MIPLVPPGYEAHVALFLLGCLFTAFATEKYPADVTAAAGAAVFLTLGLTPVAGIGAARTGARQKPTPVPAEIC